MNVFKRSAGPIRLGVMLVLGGFAGCATYHAQPLPEHADLHHSLVELRHTVHTRGVEGPASSVDLSKPLDLDDIGLLALLNDPDLRAEQGTLAAAQAQAEQSSLLPNPSIGLGYAALLGGPGTSDAYSASISQDVAALVTYHARQQSAQAQVEQVRADLLWQEWQVAQKARLLALDLYWERRSIKLAEQLAFTLQSDVDRVHAAMMDGNLDRSALAPLQAAQASADQSLSAMRRQELKDWQSLDVLLGLDPSVRIAIAKPRLAPLPAHVEDLIDNLPTRRPDLIALQLGYRSSEQGVRAAILGQFPALVLGGAWSSDTSGVRSGGPTVTFDLPLFDHNQAKIAQARATREVLHDQYQFRLDAAESSIRVLLAESKQAAIELDRADRASVRAQADVKAASDAYAQGNLDARALLDYETAAMQREQESIDLQRSLGELHVALTVELGLGLPSVLLAPPATVTAP